MSKEPIEIQSFIESLNINNICTNSKDVRESGTLFIALNDESVDYVVDAFNRGAYGVILHRSHRYKFPGLKGAFYVDNVNEAFRNAMIVLHEDISVNLSAVTGTNGKSSVVSFVSQFINCLNLKSSSIGTLGIYVNNVKNSATLNTTPGPVDIYNTISNLQNIYKVDSVTLEASSHGIHQNRLAGLKFNVAAFTNLSQDHFDYHKNIDNYFNAKKLLFTRHLSDKGVAVINVDDKYGARLQEELKSHGVQCVTLGKNADVDFIVDQRLDGGITITVDNDYSVSADLMGTYNGYNIMIAALMVRAITGNSLKEILSFSDHLRAPDGRMEKVDINDITRSIYIDYAHTPDAITNVLSSARVITKKRSSKLIAVVGAGGDRDNSKRADIGLAAYSNCDSVYVTDDNPRTEDPASIRNQVAGTLPVHNIGDRYKAIHSAIESMNAGDILIICGKGHEEFQHIGKESIEYSDVQAVKDYYREC